VEIHLSEVNRTVLKMVLEQAKASGTAAQIDLGRLAGQMESVSDEDLRLTLMKEGNSRGEEWDVAIALAKVEKDRRDFEATKRLTRSTTLFAALIGAIATLFGGGFGALATYHVSSSSVVEAPLRATPDQEQ
jgi:hypothetical protein